ncbi:PREDICTED: uncharacterized protein LOC108558914 isoform X2 [Nicrophorus vespilloides]|uniref:Uncharacterized protein LOC108558914 isoform X2 n=1 Tax=Nicrophorus vespilloides TaxID=110193 RepID=A0ABM1MA64_NICVS|nr:PREDICTED: uncharacterized protein LOC108558914 isoform X2 [Nicrophorus vespilloides]
MSFETDDRSDPNDTMSKLCRQVSIESPGAVINNCVLKHEVPVPEEIPSSGVRIRIVCAGACYKKMRTSHDGVEQPNATHHGIRDGALFSGYEVSGIVDELGADVKNVFKIGQRVVLYPYEDFPQGYTEYIVVPNPENLVPIPDNLPLSVAAMLPTGALLAKNAVIAAHLHVVDLIKEIPHNNVKILIVGTGGLALWAIRIASHHFKTPEHENKVNVTVATLRDEGFKLAKEIMNVNLVQWNEDLYEDQLIERTKDACSGYVDIVIDFATTSRSLQRSLQCLNNKGVVLINEEAAEQLIPKFKPIAEQKQQKIEVVAKGDIQQLKDLVTYVSKGEIIPPPHKEFPADDVVNVVQMLCQSEIPGRAILRFHDVQ